MGVAAKVFRNGVVRLDASGPSVAQLSKIPYVRRKGDSFASWWTYCVDLRRDLGAHLRFRDGSAEALRSLLADVRDASKGDDAEVKSWFSDETPPKNFQIEAIHFGLNLGRAIFAHATGLGKTVCACGVALGLFSRGKIRRAVFVVPASLRPQWLSEIHDKSNPRVLPASVKVAVGTPADRRAIYASPWNLLILSPEAVLNDRKALARIAPTVGLVVIDEASLLRNDGKMSDAIRSVFRSVSRRIALTATPLENGLHDLYNVVRWVEPRAFLSKEHFDERYVVWRRQQFKVRLKSGRTFTMKKVIPAGYKNLAEARAKIAPVFLRRTAEEVAVELPEVSVVRELIDLGKVQRGVYDRVAERTKSEVEGEDGEGLLAPLVALRQACDSTELVPEGAGTRASCKTDRIKDLLHGDFRGESVLIFTDYERYVRILMRDLRAFQPVSFTGPMSRRERASSVDMFRRGLRKVMILTRAGERGLNLQVSGLVILTDVPFNPAAIKQRIGRVRRIGSEHSCVRIRMLIAADTVEQDLILPKVDAKQQLSLDVIGSDELSRPIARRDGRKP